MTDTTWTCHVCSLENLNGDDECLACQSVKGTAPPVQSCWTCVVCSTQNHDGDHECRACQSVKGTAPPIQHFWTCVVCSAQNHDGDKQCRFCEAENDQSPSSEEPETLCAICQMTHTNDDMHVIIPCGHVCLCDACIQKTVTMQQLPKRCPMCRGDIEKTCKLFC